MAKFYGAVGYAIQTEKAAGVWEDVITERQCYGDLTRNSRRMTEDASQDLLNQNLSVGNSVSIVADAYAMEHFFAIRYVKWSGAYWTVNTVEVQAPRLILRMGEVYNGPTA
jgi:hypothetical protein